MKYTKIWSTWLQKAFSMFLKQRYESHWCWLHFADSLCALSLTFPLDFVNRTAWLPSTSFVNQKLISYGWCCYKNWRRANEREQVCALLKLKCVLCLISLNRPCCDLLCHRQFQDGFYSIGSSLHTLSLRSNLRCQELTVCLVEEHAFGSLAGRKVEKIDNGSERRIEWALVESFLREVLPLWRIPLFSPSIFPQFWPILKDESCSRKKISRKHLFSSYERSHDSGDVLLFTALTRVWSEIVKLTFRASVTAVDSPNKFVFRLESAIGGF